MKRVTTNFGFSSTAAEVVKGVDLSGKRAIVTGRASGIGLETAKALSAAGAAVTLAVRRPAAARAVAEDIGALTGNDAVEVRSLYVSDVASVRRFCADWTGPLQILIDNAGIMLCRTNATGLGDAVRDELSRPFCFDDGTSRRPDGSIRCAHRVRLVERQYDGACFLRRPAFQLHPLQPVARLRQSKTANVLMAVEATHRWANAGIFANALNPGAIPTNLQKHVGGKLATPLERQKTTQQGAATSVLLATSPQLEGIGGRYFEDCSEACVVHRRPDNFGGGVAP